MRCWIGFRNLLLVGVLVSLSTASAYAQKKKGGGGGTSDPPPTANLPPVTYEVEFQAVEGLGGTTIEGVTGDGRVLVRVLTELLSTPIPNSWGETIALIHPDGTAEYPELDPIAAEWDFVDCKMNRNGLIAGTGIKDGEFKLFAYIPSHDGIASILVGDNGFFSRVPTVRDVADNGLVLLYEYDLGGVVGDVAYWIWAPESGAFVPIGVNPAGWSSIDPGFVSFDHLTNEGDLYGTVYEPTGYNTTYFRSDITTDVPSSFVKIIHASSSGFAIANTRRDVRSKGAYRPEHTLSTYDADGNVVISRTFNLGVLCYECKVGEEVIHGQPVIAAPIYDEGRRFWVRIPGYDEFFVTDLMSPTALQQWQALKVGQDWNETSGGSNQNFQLVTPFESVSGAPAFVGEALRGGGAGYAGIYRVKPRPTN